MPTYSDGVEALTDIIGWFNAGRTSVLIAAAALVGVVYAAKSAQAAKTQAASSDRAAAAAQKQAEIAKEQVELGHQQIELLLRQVEQGERAEAEMRRARREALQPMILVDISPGVNDPSVFVLTITNIGTSIARNVRIKAPNEMLRSDGTKMHEWAVFTEGIKTMPPGHKLQFFFDVGFQRYKGRFPMSYAFVVDCEGPFGAAPQASYEVDLTPYKGAWAAPTTLDSVVKQIGKVAEAVHGVGKKVGESHESEQTRIERSLVDASQINDEYTSWRSSD